MGSVSNSSKITATNMHIYDGTGTGEYTWKGNVITIPSGQYVSGSGSIKASFSITWNKASEGTQQWPYVKQTVYMYLAENSSGTNKFLIAQHEFERIATAGTFTWSINSTFSHTNKNIAGKTLGILLSKSPAGGGITTFNHTCQFTIEAGKLVVGTASIANAITCKVATSGTGTLSASPTSAAQGTQVTLSPSPATGYQFSSYSSSPSVSISSNKFTMPDSAVTITATFAKQSYTISRSISPSGGGSVTLNGSSSSSVSVKYQASIPIIATPATGYRFVRWSKGSGQSGTIANATSASTTFTAGAGATTLTATFEKIDYILSKVESPSAGGTVTLGKTTANYGDSISIIASPATGYQFTGWTCSGGTVASASSASTTFTMPAGDATVTASFSKVNYTVGGVASPSGAGTITLNRSSANYGDEVAVSASPTLGWTFTGWSSDPSVTITNGKFTMPASNVTITANFRQYEWDFTLNAETGGSVSSSSTPIHCGDQATITATAETGYSFAGWTKTAGTIANVSSASTTFTMPNENASVTANFVHDLYSVTLVVGKGGTASVSSNSGYYGDQITVSATASAGYTFSGWTSSPSVTISSNKFSMPASNVTLTANFVAIDYTVTVSANPSAGGSVSSSRETATVGQSVTLSQTPNNGYLFDNWTSEQVSVVNNVFTMPANNVTVNGNFHIGRSTCSLSKTSFMGGEDITLTISAERATFTHKFRLNFGAGMDSGWVSVAAGVATREIHVPIAWSLMLAGEASKTGTLTLQTYNGETLFGEYAISDLTYSAMNGVVPGIKIWRVDASGAQKASGAHAKYTLTIPSGITSYKLRCGENYVNNPALTGDVMPNDKKSVLMADSLPLILEMSYGGETLFVYGSIPSVKIIAK